MRQPGSEFDVAAFARTVFPRAHVGWLGLHYRAHGADWCELSLPWRADLVGDPVTEVLASGPIVSLMDMSAGMAVWTALGAYREIATLDLRVDYVRPARPRATVIGRATCYRQTRTAAFVHGIAHDGDPADPLAHIAAVFMFLDRDRMVWRKP